MITHFDGQDDALRDLLARVPYLSLHAVAASCRRLRDTIGSLQFRVQRRDSGCAESAIVLVGGTESIPSDALSILYRGKWVRIAALPRPRINPIVTVFRDKLIVLGGRNEKNKTTAAVVGFDFMTRRWQELPPLRKEREGAACGVVGGKIIVAGGRSRAGSTLTTVEQFDPETCQWSYAPSLPQKVSSAAYGVIDGKLYVAGGHAPTLRSVTCLQIYDGVSWSMGPSLSVPLSHPKGPGVVLDGVLHMMFDNYGRPPLAGLHHLVFNPRTGLWTSSAVVQEMQFSSARLIVATPRGELAAIEFPLPILFTGQARRDTTLHVLRPDPAVPASNDGEALRWQEEAVPGEVCPFSGATLACLG